MCRNQNGEDAGIKGGHSGGIRDLRLRGNNITHAGAKDLASLLSEDRCARELRELDLSLNTLTAQGFKPLAVSLRGCRELVRIDVAGCRVGPDGVLAVAEFIAAATNPKLSAVILTPKAEFADRVLGDRGGLAVALRQSLQRLADSLPFARTVVELNLGAFLRADPSAAAGIEETLLAHRARAGITSAKDGAGSERDGGAGGGGGGGGGGAPRSGERLRSTPKAGTPGSRAGRDTAAAAVGVSPASGRRTTPSQRPPTARQSPGRGGTPSRSGPASRSKDGRQGATRGTGIERPRAGLERVAKPGISERTKRPGGGAYSSPASSRGASGTPPPGPSGIQRTSSKSSMRGGGATAASAGGGASGRSSGHGSAQRTTPATLAARDKQAAASTPVPHKRLHQGEELDSIDGFSAPVLDRHTPPPPPPPSSSSSSAAMATKYSSHGQQTPSPLNGSAAAPSRAHSGRVDAPAFSVGTGSSRGGGGSDERGGEDSVADVVSKVMGDTEAMDFPESPPSVAPSTWECQSGMPDGGGRRAAAGAESPGSTLVPPPSKLAHQQEGAETSEEEEAQEREEERSRKKLLRKPSSRSVVADKGKFGAVRRRAGWREGEGALRTCRFRWT